METHQVEIGQSWVLRSARHASALVLACAAVAAQGAAISLFNTGVDDAGTRLPLGSADSHWRLITGPGVTTPIQPTVVNNQVQAGNYHQSPDSMWIWANPLGTAVVNTRYVFELQFDLTGFDPDSAEIFGSWSVDNFGTILLNDAPAVGVGTFVLSSLLVSNHSTPHAFQITDGFVAGVNRLTIEVIDDRNPGGLNVFGLRGSADAGVGAVPEPSSLLSVTAALAALALVLAARRRT